MTCKHCSAPATEGKLCLTHFLEDFAALKERLKDRRRIERDRPKVMEFMADRQVFRLRPLSEPSLN